MAESFDPYPKWLGIAPADQPPNHYRLLGIDLFEDDPEVIQAAAERQMGHVRKYQLGPHAHLSQKLLNEIAAAKLCLLKPEPRQAYDAQLRQELAASARPPPIPEPGREQSPLRLPAPRIAGPGKCLAAMGLALVLATGLMVVAFLGQAAERWICLAIVAMLVFSLFVGGVGWVGPPPPSGPPASSAG